ncbi:MAG: hypothetical protein LBQ65_08525 [Tannerellaceae bacterium]|jgi:hypothetical protein|nr:hypothetical protein [Tannerellaceae bacterium]
MEDSNVFIIIVGIIFIVFGILQIILFFKIWGMTNDVREVKQKFTKEPEIDTGIDPMFYVWAIDGNVEKAKELFFPILFKNKLLWDYCNATNEVYSSECLRKIKAKYEKELRLLGTTINFEKFKEEKFGPGNYYQKVVNSRSS